MWYVKFVFKTQLSLEGLLGRHKVDGFGKPVDPGNLAGPGSLSCSGRVAGCLSSAGLGQSPCFGRKAPLGWFAGPRQ